MMLSGRRGNQGGSIIHEAEESTSHFTIYRSMFPSETRVEMEIPYSVDALLRIRRDCGLQSRFESSEGKARKKGANDC